MKEQVDILIKLQRIETETAVIKLMLEAVPEKLDMLNHKLNEFEQTLTQEESLLSDLKKAYRSFETEVQTNLSKVKEKDTKLRSVKNNKEYQALLKEIEELKKRNFQIEDDMLEDLDRIEKAEKEMNIKKSEQSAFKKQISNKKAAVEKEAQKGEKKLAKLTQEWNDISKNVKPDLFKIFIRIKEWAEGDAVSPVKDAVCQGCHVNIPPQMYNDLQSSERLNFCPNCERIIYWDGPVEN